MITLSQTISFEKVVKLIVILRRQFSLTIAQAQSFIPLLLGEYQFQNHKGAHHRKYWRWVKRHRKLINVTWNATDE